MKPKTFWNFFWSAYTVVPLSFGICWYICTPAIASDPVTNCSIVETSTHVVLSERENRYKIGANANKDALA